MVTGREACVVSVRVDAQKFFVHERVEHHLTHCPIDMAQTLRLFGIQPLIRHFQELGAETVEYVLDRSHDGNPFRRQTYDAPVELCASLQLSLCL